MAGAAPLQDITVADFSRVLAAPYATMLLADFGATVIKIERPREGDDTRAWGPPFVDGTSTYFASVNRNKLSIALDLADDADLRIARAIVDRSDVVIDNFRAGALERFGLSVAEARRRHPALISARVSGFGDGAGAALPGYDLLVQAVGGLMSVTGEPDGPPLKAGVAVVDVLAGLHLLVGILLALRVANDTGVGQDVHVSLVQSLLAGLVNQSSAYALAGVVPRRLGNRHPSIAPYEVFDASDRPMIVAVGNDDQFRRLCDVLDLSELAADDRFATNAARVGNVDELHRAISAVLRGSPAGEWERRCRDAGVPVGVINDMDEAFRAASALGLDVVCTLDDGASTVANPIGLSSTAPRYRSSAPELDGDREAVLAWLGRTSDVGADQRS